MTNHPITPPPELVAVWSDAIYRETADDDQRDLFIATRAAQWGYDQHERTLLDAMHTTVPLDLVMPKAQLFAIDPHPVIPPADLLKEWEDLWHDEQEHADVLLIRAFQAGADQELDACCQWISDDAEALRIARRPKSPSLAEEALDELYISNAKCCLGERSAATIRRALERLKELEGGT